MNVTGRFSRLGLQDLADVRLVHAGVNVHVLVHVRGDDEQSPASVKEDATVWPVLDLAVDDDAVHRGDDLGVARGWSSAFSTPALAAVDVGLGDDLLGLQGQPGELELVHLLLGDVVLVGLPQVDGPLLVAPAPGRAGPRCGSARPPGWSRAAFSRSRAACGSRGSIRARIWSFFTWSLKSTRISRIGPETNDPTVTDCTGLTGPVELTTVSIFPVVTLAVVKTGTDLAFRYCWPRSRRPPARRRRRRG